MEPIISIPSGQNLPTSLIDCEIKNQKVHFYFGPAGAEQEAKVRAAIADETGRPFAFQFDDSSNGVVCLAWFGEAQEPALLWTYMVADPEWGGYKQASYFQDKEHAELHRRREYSFQFLGGVTPLYSAPKPWSLPKLDELDGGKTQIPKSANLQDLSGDHKSWL